MRIHRKALVGVAAVVALGLVGTALASAWYRSYLMENRRVQVDHIASHSADALNSTVNRRLWLIDGLAAFVTVDPLLPELRSEFPIYAAALASGTSGIRAITVAPGGVTRLIYPSAGNGRLLGNDLAHDPRPEVRADVARAIDSRQVVVSGPHELTQGGLGMLTRKAVYDGEHYWGLVTIALDVPPMLEEAGVASASGGLSEAIRDDRGRVFAGSPAVFAGDPVTHSVKLPDGRWTIGAVPGGGWAAAVRGQLEVFVAVSVLLVLLVAIIVYLVTTRQATLARLVHERTTELNRELDERRRTEAALRAGEEKFRLLTENTPDIMSIQDRDLRYDWVVNPALGLTPEDFIGKTDRDLVGAEQFEMVRALKQKVMDSGEELHAEVPLTDEQGRESIYDGTYIPRRDEDGNVTGILSYLRDITERKRAEATLQQALEEMDDLYNHAPSAYHSLDADGLIVRANDTELAWLGYSREEYVGVKHIADLLAPESFETFKESFPALKDRSFINDVEVTLIRKDGTTFPVLVNATAERDAHGRFVRSLSSMVDITERKRAIEALARGAAQLKLALSGAVTALGATTELRDPYTAGHQRRVAELACAIATELGWDEDRIETLRTAGLLHDIGKIVVPAEILSRPARLSETEMELVRQHAQAGADTVANIDFGSPVGAMIAQHHERLDGSGYPAGLKEARIMCEARVLAVADVVEAMISHRPYRAALSVDIALAEIEGGAGRVYDAAACAACIRLFRERGFRPSD